MDEAERKHLLTQLEKQQIDLIFRLKHIRSAILGLGGKVSNNDLDDLLQLEGEPKEKRAPIVVPSTYNKGLPQIIKIAYVIKLLGGGAYVTEIADKMVELDSAGLPVPEEQKLLMKRNIAMLTSYLYKDGRLTVERIAGKYKFMLVE